MISSLILSMLSTPSELFHDWLAKRPGDTAQVLAALTGHEPLNRNAGKISVKSKD